MENPSGVQRTTASNLELSRGKWMKKEIFQHFMENAAEGFLAVDEELVVVFINPKAGAMFGFPPESAPGKPLTDLLGEEDEKSFAAMVREGNHPSREMKITLKDGTALWVRVSVAPFFDERRKSSTSLIFLTDIGELEQTRSALRDSRIFVERFADAAPYALYILDLDTNRYDFVNHSYQTVTGSSREELLGKGPNIHAARIHPDDMATVTLHNTLCAGARKGEILECEYRYRCNKGEYRWFLTTDVVFSSRENGTARQILGTVHDVTHRRRTEEKIKASLYEKEVLLREVHHRVKNNMQVISSLLTLQAQGIRDTKLLEVFEEARGRVAAMALVHEALYQSEDMAEVNMNQYISRLAGMLFEAARKDPKAVHLVVEAEDVTMDIDSLIPCGLIFNELISNSLKHAFPCGRKGEISIRARRLTNKDMELVVSDNGVGLPVSIDFRHTRTLGLQLVTGLAEGQLGGTIDVNRVGGTTFTIRIRKKERKGRLNLGTGG